jgi:hypothetical protein
MVDATPLTTGQAMEQPLIPRIESGQNPEHSSFRLPAYAGAEWGL